MAPHSCVMGTIVEAQGMDPLVELLIASDSFIEREQAAWILFVAAHTIANHQAGPVDPTAAAVVEPLLQLLVHGSEEEKESALVSLWNITSIDAASRAAVRDKRAFAALSRLVSNGNKSQREYAARTLGTLAVEESCHLSLDLQTRKFSPVEQPIHY